MSDPLGPAKRRGKDWCIAEWRKPEMLDLNRVTEWTGIEDTSILSMIKKRLLYRVYNPAQNGTWRYPVWQFKADTIRLHRVLQHLGDASERPSGWLDHHFFVTPHVQLNGTPAEWIIDRRKPIEDVLKLIDQMKPQDQQGAT